MRLFILIFAFCLTSSVHAELRYELQPQPLAEGVWLLEGSTANFDKANGGNIVNTGFIVTDSGVVVIDSGPSRRYGEAMREAIARVTDRPIIKVLLTHHHPDHVLGNQAFAGVPIAALAGTTELLREQGNAMAEKHVPPGWRLDARHRSGAADRERHDRYTGSRWAHAAPVELRGHTGADLAILDERSGVLFAGDILFYQRALTTPNSPGLDVWLADLDTLQALPWKRLVAGHGPVADDAAPFAQMRDYLGWLDGLLRDSAASGADMNEVIQSPIPERFAGISLTRYELIRSVSHLYPRYEADALERVDQ